MLESEIGTRGTDVPAWARERAEALQGLYVHLFVYVLVNGGLALINWVTRPEGGEWWVKWPLMGWGIGLLVHIGTVIVPVFSPHWVERRAAEIARRDR